MFEKLDERARVTVVRAREKAVCLGHDYVGTEHLLLALLRDEHGEAARAPASLGVGWHDVRRQVEILSVSAREANNCR